MMRYWTIQVAILVASSPLYVSVADTPRLLELLFNDSEACVVATIESHCKSFHDGDVCTVMVERVLKGALEQGRQTLHIERIQFAPPVPGADLPRDELPPLLPGRRFVLFLKRRGGAPGWTTSDGWFGTQPYNYAMVLELEHQVKRQAQRE